MRHSLSNEPIHPAAEQIEQLIHCGKAVEAQTLLQQAQAQDPLHTDLRAAEGLLHAYLGQEDKAIELLESAGHGPRARKLAKLLSEHLLCRQQMAAKTGRRDGVAHLKLAKIRLCADRPLENVGITVSACLIVKNEAKNLPRCLNSIKGFVDEIVIVDTGSTDDSIEIAEGYGAKIGHFAWNDDFSAARNHALSLATGNWALWIDADEELTPDSIQALRRAVVRPHFGGYAIEIVNFTDDRSDAAQYIHKPIRLFRLAPGVRFSGKIHEQVSPSLSEKNLPWAYLDGARILHYGYRPTEMVERGKVQRTVTLLEKELAEDPENAFQWFNLANAHTAANDFAQVERASAECVKFLSPGDPIGPLAYQLWSNSLLKLNKPGEAARVCDLADKKGFGGILNEFERANALLALGLVEEGLEAANRCLALEWPKDMTGDLGIAEFKRYIVRGQLLALKGDFSEAIAMFERALRVNPQYGPALYSLAATLEKAGRLEEALDGFLAGKEDPSLGALCLRGAARVATALRLSKRSADLYREAWHRDVRDQDTWVGWIQAADACRDLPMIVEAYEAYSAHFKPTADIFVNWGRALDEMGEYERARACFSRALEQEPLNPNVRFNFGDLLYKLEEFGEAAELYQAGLQQDPMNASGWFVLGNSLARLGVIEGARMSYQQALRIRPDYAEAIHNLETICEIAA